MAEVGGRSSGLGGNVLAWPSRDVLFAVFARNTGIISAFGNFGMSADRAWGYAEVGSLLLLDLRVGAAPIGLIAGSAMPNWWPRARGLRFIDCSTGTADGRR